MKCRPKEFPDRQVVATDSAQVVPQKELSSLSVLHFVWHRKPIPRINTIRAGSRCFNFFIGQRQVCATSGFRRFGLSTWCCNMTHSAIPFMSCRVQILHVLLEDWPSESDRKTLFSLVSQGDRPTLSLGQYCQQWTVHQVRSALCSCAY